MPENITPPKISALAITFNEADNIRRYIESLSFADEIIIVDSHSTDGTAALAEELGARVLLKEFVNFSEQRNFAIRQATHDWIVFFDLDEIVTPQLEQELKALLANPGDTIAYSVKRKFHFMGRHIRFGGWQTDRVIRVFNRNHCCYNGNLVHEVISAGGKTAPLKSPVDHYSYKSFDNYNSKLNLYSRLQADSLYAKKKRPNAYHFLFRPFYRFCWQYFYRLGMLDGKEGFVLAYVHSFSVYKRYLQLWLKYRKLS